MRNKTSATMRGMNAEKDGRSLGRNGKRMITNMSADAMKYAIIESRLSIKCLDDSLFIKPPEAKQTAARKAKNK
jgi:hypothetical protein